MPTAYLRSRLEERAQISDLMSGVLEKAAEGSRDITADEEKLIAGWEKRAAVLDDEIARLETIDRGIRTFQASAGRMAIEDEKTERREAAKRETPDPEIRRSLGRRFTDSEEFKRYRGRGSMDPVEFGGFVETRAAITTGEVFADPYRAEVALPTYTAPLLNVIGHETVTSGSVEYVTTSGVSAAAEVAEGELKPEATLGFVPFSQPLVTYAHWKPITRQAIEDAPRIESIVETALRHGLQLALASAAAEVITGTDWAPVTGDDLSTGIRLGVGAVQANGYAPNAVLLNPADYAALDVSAASAANNGPTGYASYWGVTPVPVPDIPAGSAYVGDFSSAVTWFDRNVASVYMTDSHADYFIRNILIILAETRALFAPTAYDAAVSVTVGAAVESAPAAKTAAK